jgi:hypothetical protein
VSTARRSLCVDGRGQEGVLCKQGLLDKDRDVVICIAVQGTDGMSCLQSMRVLRSMNPNTPHPEYIHNNFLRHTDSGIAWQ